MKPVVILGGGIAGITAALELSKAGVEATLVEKSPFFGGKAATFACKATDACQKCGACRVEQGLRDLMAAPGVTLMAQTELVASQPNNGGWHLTLQSQPRVIDAQLCTNCGVCLEECPVPGAIQSTASAENHPRYAVNPALCRYFQDQSCTRCQEVCPTQAIDLTRPGAEVTMETRSIIVATGYQTASPPCRGDYTNYDLPNIITGWELEEMMKEGGRLVRPSDGRPVRHLAFIQCVGSRDQEHTYCSRVCCAYGLRLARLVHYRWPECQVTTFYMDLQNVGPDPKAYEETVRQEIELIRALPGDLMATADGSLRLRYLDEESGQGLYRVVDLLVLTVGIWPGVDNPKLAAMLQLELTPDGFLKDGLEAGPESRGIFLAGTAAGPQSILECIAQATQSVQRVREYLEART